MIKSRVFGGLFPLGATIHVVQRSADWIVVRCTKCKEGIVSKEPRGQSMPLKTRVSVDSSSISPYRSVFRTKVQHQG